MKPLAGDLADIIAQLESAIDWETQDERARQWKASRADDDQATAHNERLADLLSYGVPGKDAATVAEGKLAPTDAVKALRRLDPDQCLVLLSGPCGTGKTTAAADWLARNSRTWRGATAPMFLAAYEFEQINRFSREDRTRIEQARRLVIDEVGAEIGDKSGSVAGLLYAVINERYANERPTLITTNLTPSQFKERYGERVADRIRESGRVIVLNGASMRGK